MVDDKALSGWFCDAILSREPSLMRFIRRNWRDAAEAADLRQEIYERVLTGARRELPRNAGHYLFAVARNHLINRAKRAQIVSFDLVADMSAIGNGADLQATERHVSARDELRRVQAGLDLLPPRCREVVRLRKVEGLSTRETAERLGVGIDTVEKQLTLGVRAITDFVLGGTGKIHRWSAAAGSARAGVGNDE
jgi:RNA polymerase sigma factor (sigma-70 family)